MECIHYPSGSAYVPVEGSREHSNEPLDSITCGRFLNQLSDSKFLKKEVISSL